MPVSALAKGINYDTGFCPEGTSSRARYEPAEVARDMHVIAEQLGCTSVRISGADPRRLSVAGQLAADVGLQVWFAPFPCELEPVEMSAMFVECAERAERLRVTGASVVLVLGCELSLFARGFLPGRSLSERIAVVTSARPVDRDAGREQLNSFLRAAACAARQHFAGSLTYASGMWEDVDWSPFDIVGVDAYRDAHNERTFAASLKRCLAHAKPVAVTEFGCCTYHGAAARGGLGWAIIDSTSQPARLDGDYVRGEAEQAGYLREMLTTFDAAGVEFAFWHTYASWSLPHDERPRHDLDLAGYGLVRVTDTGLEPKLAFHELADWPAAVRTPA